MKESAKKTSKTGLRRVGVPAVVALPLLVGILALLLCASASADGRFGQSGYPESALAGGLTAPKSLAVSEKEGGDVYVVDAGTNQRVAEFEPDGTWVRAFGWGIVPGAAAGSGDLSAGSTSVTNVTTTLGAFGNGPSPVGRFVTGAGIPPNTMITKVTSTELVLSNPATASGTGVSLNVTAGPGNVPTNEVEQVTIKATGGSFKLSFTSLNPGSTTATTGSLAYNATAAQVQSALEGLSNVGAGNVTVSGGPGDELGTQPYVVEFKSRFVDTNVHPLAANGATLSGPSSGAAVATTTEGGAALETCTTVCVGETIEEESFDYGNGSNPGQLKWADEIAVDNDPGSPSYGDVYVVDQRNYRVQKYTPDGKFLLMFGGGVDKTTGADVCTAADIAGGDVCGAGVSGSGPGHFYDSNPSVFNPPGEWANDGNNSIAVGPGGTVYVGDFGRIQEFEPNGTYAGELKLSDPEPQFVTSIAVDASGNIFERSATYQQFASSILGEVPGVREFNASHALINTFDAVNGSQPVNLAVDTGGDLFVSDANSGDFQFRAFKPGGTLYSYFTSNQAEICCLGNTPNIAIGNVQGNLYAPAFNPGGAHVAVIPLPEPGAPKIVIGSEHATDVETATASLHATINPQGYDTHYHFEYVDQQDFENGGFSNPATKSTASTDMGLLIHDEPVVVAISGLTHDTTYHFRAVAESTEGTTFGEDDQFTTLPPVTIRNLTTQTVGPELVTIKAELNPNNSATSYTIRYGEDVNYEGGEASGTLPIGNQLVRREATFTGLRPNTTYHYQLTAENKTGQVNSSDRTFTTEHTVTEENAAADCSNQTLREENSSLELPDCRAYEQVSPPFKAGSSAGGFKFYLSPKGDRAVYTSQGAFAGAVETHGGNTYVAHRTANGWVTQAALGRPAGPDAQPVGPFEFTSELDKWIFPLQEGGSWIQGNYNSESESLYYGSIDGSFVQATPTLRRTEGGTLERPAGVTETQAGDFSRLIIGTSYRFLEGDPRPSLQGGGVVNRMYAVNGAGGPTPSLSLVAEVPPSITGEGCGLDAVVAQALNLISADGSTVFYDAPLNLQAGAQCSGPYSGANKNVLFVRVGEEPAARVSAPLPAQCGPSSPCATAAAQEAHFDGASPDGHLAWFTTTQPLVDADADSTTDLYLAKIENAGVSELVQVSHGDGTDPTPGVNAGVKGVVRVAQEGSVAYFAATGLLTTKPNALGQEAAQGADNLYAYDASSGELSFVTRLCSAAEESGNVADPACPADLSGFEGGDGNDTRLWESNSEGTLAQVTPDGRYLVFDTYARLTADDTDNALDVYRYDLQSGELVRVSLGRNGNDGNGNDNEFPALIPATELGGGQASTNDGKRALSDDGSTIIFKTAAPLVSQDTNEANDVYEWEEAGQGTCTTAGGCISVPSSGLDPHGSNTGIISASGGDITFISARSFAPADTDGAQDVYSAHVNGGFHYVPPEESCLSAETCHGPAGEQSLLPNYVSEETHSGGNGPQQLRCGKGRHRVKKHGQLRCVPNRHRHHKGHKHRSARSGKRPANVNPGGHK